MEQIKVRGPQGELSAFDTGRGEGLPVLFLHADSGRATQWTQIAEQIGDERRAIALDFRGSGDSAPARDDDYSYAGRAADVASAADALALGHFVIVAHSGGAAVALEYAAQHPERVAGLLLVEPPTDPRAIPQEVRDGMVRDLAGPHSLQVQQDFYRTIAGDDPAVRERVLADCAVLGSRARAGLAQALATWDPKAALDAWQGPLLVLVIPRNENEHALYRLRPGVPHQVIADAGHWLQLDQPERVRQVIREFVKQLEAQAPPITSTRK
jgi:pimeloyl-ACP methyl ester carboxylesterase